VRHPHLLGQQHEKRQQQGQDASFQHRISERFARRMDEQHTGTGN